MRSRFQFTLRRALLSTTLIATGFAMWPVGRAVLSVLPESTWDLFGALFAISFFALPAAGIGAIFDRIAGGLFIGATVGLAVWVSLPGVE
jgi:hypothetical protein